jgi:hypothetical protein
LRKIYRTASSRFLQSVVVVDDRAALAPDEGEIVPDQIEDPRPRLTIERLGPSPGVAPEKERQEQVEAAEEGDADENRLDAAALVNRFAELGIVCAALRPDGDADADQRRVLNAGRRADIVTLDWHLGDAGARARQLLDQLSTPEGRRLRLVAVYTGDPDVSRLSDEILGLSDVHSLGDLRFQRGPTRILLLFKEGSDRLGAPAENVTQVSDLPDRLIDEFTAMCSGLVRAATMSSLGAVREAMPEILGVLEPELDAAYVGHRLAQIRPDDAGDHLADLIVSELRSIVEDDDGRIDSAGAKAVQLWLDSQGEAALRVEREALGQLNLVGSGDGDTFAEVIQQYERLRGRKKYYPTKYFLADEDAERADARLAERMSTRHRYSSARAERLELGIVIRSLADNTYWVCVQPLCDSVRLVEQTRMPLLPLTVVATENKKFDLVLERTGGQIRLQAVLAPSRMNLVTFVPDLAAGAVVASVEPGAGYGFKDAEGHEWELVCRLKPEQAQRFAHRLGVEFSRVGLNESEWLRRKAGGRSGAR